MLTHRRSKETNRPTRTRPHDKLIARELTTIRYRYATTLLSQRKLSRQFGAAQSTIARIVNGEAWKHLPLFVPSVSESEKRKSNCGEPVLCGGLIGCQPSKNIPAPMGV